MIKARLTQSISTRNVHEFMNPFQNNEHTYIIMKGSQTAKATSMIDVLALDLRTRDMIEIIPRGVEKIDLCIILEHLKDYLEPVEG